MERIMSVGIVLLGAVACAYGTDLPEFPFLCTAAEATIQVAPDIATISFDVTHYDADSEKGLESLREKSHDVVAVMEEFGISPQDAKASDVFKREVYEEIDRWQEGKVVGYHFRRSFALTLTNLDTCPKVVQRLHKVDHVADIRTAFDVTGRKEREDELVEHAISDARNRAERLARGAGVELGAVYALSEMDLRQLGDYFLTPAMRRARPTRPGGGPETPTVSSAAADAVIDSISKPAMITLRASIRVLYRIRPSDES